jgi:integrase
MATIERRTSARGTSYRVKIRLDGKPPVSRTFTRHSAAKAWGTATEAALRDGTYATGSGHSVADAIDVFLASKLATKKDQRMPAARAAWWRNEIGKIKLRDLTASAIERCLSSLAETPQLAKKPGGAKKPRSGATVNRYRAVLSAVLTWAQRRSPPWINVNPARATEHRKEIPGRTRFLSFEERERLLLGARQSGSPNLYLAVVLSLATGGRRGEVLGLRWSDVDLNRGTVTFRNTKNSDSRSIPLPPDAVVLLRERHKVVRIDTDLVFPSKKDPRKPADIRGGFQAALRAAGITDFHWHDQRHSAASALADMGASLLDIGTILGHRSQQTTRKYAHLTESRLRGLIEGAAQRHRVS